MTHSCRWRAHSGWPALSAAAATLVWLLLFSGLVHVPAAQASPDAAATLEAGASSGGRAGATTARRLLASDGAAVFVDLPSESGALADGTRPGRCRQGSFAPHAARCCGPPQGPPAPAPPPSPSRPGVRPGGRRRAAKLHVGHLLQRFRPVQRVGLRAAGLPAGVHPRGPRLHPARPHHPAWRGGRSRCRARRDAALTQPACTTSIACQ